MIASLSQAAHLVGGQISYTCLGNNNYEIRLRVYRDCASGGAALDANAHIAVYDVNNNLVIMVSPPMGPIVNVPTNATGNPCVSAPPGLCTEYTDYIDTINLPPLPGGYVITHQRCCRNGSISNIMTPGSVGNTYTIQIPDMDTTCNSSAEFIGTAPIVICMNEPLSLPITVNEKDGDSLYFDLCDIYAGGASSGGSGCNMVIPNPPCPPPYSPVSFLSPFSSTNPLPAAPAFAIDAGTGILSGTPNQIGQYVVGICVTEFRNGSPLSATRLDYQFNVTNCIVNVVSDMITPSEDPAILCDGLTVHFTSESKNSVSLLWNFGDPASVEDTSTASNPSYTYNVPGDYTVTLIANPGLQCSDTLKIVFNVRYPIYPDFRDSGIYCFEANELNFETIGNYPQNTVFEWNFGGDANIPVSTLKEPPPIIWGSPGKKYITLRVRIGACEWEKLDSLTISNLSVAVDAGPDQTIREGEVIILAGSGAGPLGTYYWFSDHSVDFSDPFSQNTSSELRDGEDTVKFYVRVTDALGCEGLDSMFVFVLDDGGTINFFSPNGDGINETFDISDINPDGDCFLSILNRWGSEVYFEENYKNNWTGVNRGGNALPDGTYYYILKCGSDVKYMNAVTIMRFQR